MDIPFFFFFLQYFSIRHTLNHTGTIGTELPNNDLYNFDGYLQDATDERHSLSINQVLLRGTILRNTPYVYGIVIFSGEETKIRMNANKNPRTKAPSIQRIINRVVLIIFSIVVGLAAFFTAMSINWQSKALTAAWYLHQGHSDLATIVFQFIILFNTMIPISLYVTMEIIKLVQAYWIINDADMYHAETNTPASANTCTINEELGQVNIVFSDKTGTLTDNVMLFRNMSVAGWAYLHDADVRRRLAERERERERERELASELIDDNNSLGRQSSRRSGSIIRLGKELRSSIQGSIRWARREGSENSLSTRSAHQTEEGIALNPDGASTPPRAMPMPTIANTIDLVRQIEAHPDVPAVQQSGFFLLAMALCHTAVPEHDPKTGEITYQAASPDEHALVSAARDLGFVVTERTLKSVKVLIPGQENPVEFKILDVVEFSSKRKRMSVVVRLPDGRILLLCKGADSVILERLIVPDVVVSPTTPAWMSSPFADIKGSREKRRPSAPISPVSSGIPRNLNNYASGSTPRSEPARLPFDSDEIEEHRDGVDPILPPLRSSSTLPGGVFASYHDAPLQEEQWEYARTLYHVQQFATDGLRTLLYAHRFLDPEEYAQWKERYAKATARLEGRQEEMEKVAEEVERNMRMTGATAIEDKLQQGVPDTIERLRRAGIKMW